MVSKPAALLTTMMSRSSWMMSNPMGWCFFLTRFFLSSATSQTGPVSADGKEKDHGDGDSFHFTSGFNPRVSRPQREKRRRLTNAVRKESKTRAPFRIALTAVACILARDHLDPMNEAYHESSVANSYCHSLLDLGGFSGKLENDETTMDFSDRFFRNPSTEQQGAYRSCRSWSRFRGYLRRRGLDRINLFQALLSLLVILWEEMLIISFGSWEEIVLRSLTGLR